MAIIRQCSELTEQYRTRECRQTGNAGLKHRRLVRLISIFCRNAVSDGLTPVTGSGAVSCSGVRLIVVDSKQVELQLRFMFCKNYKLEHNFVAVTNLL